MAVIDPNPKECGSCRKERNELRIVFFTLGFIFGFIGIFALQNAPVVITRAQMIYNICPRIFDGSMWCTGP